MTKPQLALLFSEGMVDRDPIQDLIERLQWTVRARWAIIAFLIASAVASQAIVRSSDITYDLNTVLPGSMILLVTAAYNLCLRMALRRPLQPPMVTTIAYGQITLDILITTALVYLSGSADSPYFMLYFLLIVAAGFLLPGSGAYLAAALASLIYSGLIWSESVALVPHAYIPFHTSPFTVEISRSKTLLALYLTVAWGWLWATAFFANRLSVTAYRRERRIRQLHQEGQERLQTISALQQEAQARLRELTTLLRVDEAISRSLSLDETLKAILQEAMGIVGKKEGCIILHDPTTNTMYIAASQGLPPEVAQSFNSRPVYAHEGTFRIVLQTGEMLEIPDAPSDPRVLQGVGHVPQQLTNVPVKVGPRVIGVIALDALPPNDQARRLLLSLADRAAIAIENARLYEETHRRAERLTVVNRIGRAVSSTLSLGELVEVVYQEITHAFQGDAFFLALYDSDRDELDYRIRIDEGMRYPPVRRPLGAGFTSLIVSSKKPLLVRDYEKEKESLPSPKLWGTMKVPASWLGVPMLIGDQVVGVLSLQAYRPNAYDEEDLLLLSTIADQVAIALHNARLYEATKRHLLHERRLNELIYTLSSEMNPAALIPRLLAGLAELVGADAAVLALLDQERGVLTYPYYYNLPDSLQQAQIPADAGLAGLAIQTRRPILLDDYQQHPAALPQWIDMGVRSLLAVPLLVGDQALGALGLFSLGQVRPFTQEAVATVEAVARLIAVAFQRAWLFEGESRRRQEAQTLYQTAMALSSSLDRNEIVERILSQLQQVVPFDSASVQLLKGDALEIVGGRGFPNLSELLGIRFPLDGDNPNREVARTHLPLILDDAPAKYPNFNKEPFVRMPIRSWLGVPMLVGNRFIGMITLDKCQPGFYTQEHVRLAMAFAIQAAIAIENARLYEETRQLFAQEQRRAEQLTVVNELSRIAVSSLKVEDLLRDMAIAIQKGFNYDSVAIFLVEGEYAVLKAHAGKFAPYENDYRQHVSQGLVGWAITHAQTVIVGDTRKDHRFLAAFPGETEVCSELCVPIHSDDAVIGVIDVESTMPDAFDRWDWLALDTLSEQIALALKNAWAYTSLGEEKARLELLYNIAAEANSTLDLDEILTMVIRYVTTAFSGTRGYIFLMEPGTDRLRLRAVSGIEVSLEQVNETLELHIGQGLVGWVALHKRPAMVDDVAQDERWVYWEELDRGMRSAISLPLIRGEEVLGAINILHPTPGFFAKTDMRLLMAIAQQVSMAIANARLYETVQRQAQLDSLTQVYNHTELILRLKEKVAEAAETGQPVSLIMLDIDYFKDYNDRYGHVTGDLILTAIVQAVRANIKKTDIVGRWGGEEFGIILPNTDAPRAFTVAQRIRRTLADMSLTDGKGQEVIKPTVSQGIATFPTVASSAEELIDLADAALYRAKAMGRDQIQVAV